MTFKLISPKKLEVTLSTQDCAAAGINWECDSPNDIRRLKKYLLSVLAQAQSRLEQPFYTGERLLIEIHPEPDGSAYVFFISEEELFHTFCEPEVFGFNDSEQLLNACLKLFRQYSHRLLKSSLYLFNDEWLLTLNPIDGDIASAADLIAEFGGKRYGSALTAAVISEHGKPIIGERALDMINYYFE